VNRTEIGGGKQIGEVQSRQSESYRLDKCTFANRLARLEVEVL